jgi:hypothetical protein
VKLKYFFTWKDYFILFKKNLLFGDDDDEEEDTKKIFSKPQMILKNSSLMNDIMDVID